MPVPSAIPPAAGKFAYVSNLSSVRADPCYNHGAMMANVLSRLAPFGLPCTVVDDGSEESTRLELERLAAEQPQITLIRLAENAGKGAAVIRGTEESARAGYTHAVQVDADGQHAIEDIPGCWRWLNAIRRR